MKELSKTSWVKIIFILIVCILMEVLLNNKAVFSMDATNQHLNYIRENNTVYTDDMNGVPGYLYVDVNAVAENGASVPVTVRIAIQDQGQSAFYDLHEYVIYPPIEKSKYVAIYSYGEVEAMHIAFETSAPADIKISDIVYDAKVPWFISGVRIAGMFGFMLFVWCLRPGSFVYSYKWTKRSASLVTATLIVANVIFFWFLVRSNPAFLNPVWPYHQQYHKLAVALSRGEVSMDVASEETIAGLCELENPYDPVARMNMVPDAGNVWDTCYFNEKFYVYFGIVPVLLFYLPYYLVTGSAFPTWLGVFVVGGGIVGGVYYLLGSIRKKWFPDISYSLYLLLAVISSNCLNISPAMLRADFYYLPILMAMCFCLWGLGLMISATDEWKVGGRKICLKIVVGAFCLALTAGCRPQFLVGSFLLIPLFWPIFRIRSDKKQMAVRLLCAAVPYIMVATGLMFYNYIRFGSVFDFGANYNLTTNDMTQRGFNLGRLPDGIFMYLFQPISCKLTFPFVEVAAFDSPYMGVTIRDWTYGGAFWTRPLLLVVFALGIVRRELKQKKLYGFTLLSMCMSFVVVVADTEMAGILNRYYTDFLWLLMIPAVIIIFQLFEESKGTQLQMVLIGIVLIAGVGGIFYELGIAIRGSELIRDNAHRYYLIKSIFQ